MPFRKIMEKTKKIFSHKYHLNTRTKISRVFKTKRTVKNKYNKINILLEI